MSAPIHVLHPPRLPVGTATRVALAPIVGSGTLGAELEQALIAQQQVGPRPLQIVTAQSLAEASPLRLVSTAALTSELTAIHAARAAGADVLMLGEVVQDDLQDPDASGKQLPAELSRLQLAQAHLVGPSAVQRPQRIAVAWRVFDVQTGRSVGSHTLAIDRIEVDRKYPDLQFSLPLPRERVLAGSARQTWQSITPYVERENVVLDLPWLQPGAARVRQGNGLARQGRWDLAEAEWTAAVARYPYSNAAKHNLALAQVSREDFSAAKETLGTLGPLRSRKRQAETLVWIDQRHRWHHAAMGLPTPEEGWSFPEPTAITPAPDSVETAADPWEQPWWTAIPFTKPPGWSWRQWYFQPWAL